MTVTNSPAATLKEISFEETLRHRSEGTALIDLRPASQYLSGHIPGSLPLHYEAGPGMASRARDCLPLDVPLLLLGFDHGDLAHAAGSLRGKGFTVLGVVPDPLRHWVGRFGRPTETEVLAGAEAPPGTLLDVGDSGAPRTPDALVIPVEQLWPRAGELTGHEKVTVAAGAGVRAALAVGILERAGVQKVGLWQPLGAPRRTG